MALEEPAHDARQRPIACRGVEPLGHLVERQVRRFLDPGQDQIAVRVDPVGAIVAAPLVRCKIATLPISRDPADRGRDADPKTRGRRTARCASINRINDTTAKI